MNKPDTESETVAQGEPDNQPQASGGEERSGGKGRSGGEGRSGGKELSGGSSMPITTPRLPHASLVRVRLGLIVAILGLLIFLLGSEPGLFGLDRSPVTGFIQISVFLVGLGIICLGGYMTLNTLWNGRTKSIIYDIGLRLVATGYVISVASGMADIFGFGGQKLPSVPRFGAWQKIGVISGQLVIGLGFLMMIPYPRWMRILRLKGVRRMKNTSGQARGKRAPRSSSENPIP